MKPVVFALWAAVSAVAIGCGDNLGEALSPTIDFGGVQLPTQELFIAALAGGPARLPSPLPAAPTISSVTIDSSRRRRRRASRCSRAARR